MQQGEDQFTTTQIIDAFPMREKKEDSRKRKE
jgi:hypothetical protein